MKRYRSFFPLLAFGLVLAIAAIAYLPGLHGSFLFDDFGNLPALGAQGPINSPAAFWRYLTSGQADPTGRPIALLSFLLDARDWPADPFAFKRTNLLLHLFNGLLLFFLLDSLGQAWVERLLGEKSTHASVRARARWAACIGAAMWLLHPLLVSTTLYIVQREAMLAATFVLLGLLGWLRGRAHCQHGRSLSGALWSATGLGVGTALAVLSKANGVLLPLLALLIEVALLGPFRMRAKVTTTAANRAIYVYRAIRVSALWLPTLAIISWLLYQGVPDVLTGNRHGRPWTVGERLLTEPRVLVDYLHLLLLPRPYTSGLFNDQTIVSHSLLDPPSTVPAILAVLCLAAWGLFARQRWQPTALAILFYLGGQLVESTVLPLELYFEHRNYLPALLLFWPIALFICGVPQHAATGVRSLPMIRLAPRAALAMAAVFMLAIMTRARADL